MTAQEVQKLQPGDEIHWTLGKNYFKGKLLGFGRDVADMKSLLVEDSNGVQDEILHVFLVEKQDYIEGVSKLNKHKIVKNNIINGNNFVQSKIEKNEEISDEENIEKEISEEEISQEISEKEIIKESQNIPVEIPKPITNLSNTELTKVSSPRGNNTEMKPNLKTLQILLQKQGYHIERDPNKWVRYILTLPNSESVDFSYKGKVWELYNIYIESGIQGLLNLR